VPIIRVDGPKVPDVEKKRVFVKEVTDAASALFGMPAQNIVVLLKETQPENVGVGGELILDRRKREQP